MKKILYKIGKFFDKYLGWHSCKTTVKNGYDVYGICKYCGSACMKDSQGNWFKIN